MSTEDLGPLRLVKCVRCGKDKWRGPDPVCAVCRDHQEHPVGSGEGRTKQVNTDLLTLIDFCNGMADRIRADWSDPRSECRAIWDAHDMAHVLLGGDRQRSNWSHAKAFATPDDSLGEAWEDVYRRMQDLLKRLEAQSD